MKHKLKHLTGVAMDNGTPNVVLNKFKISQQGWGVGIEEMKGRGVMSANIYRGERTSPCVLVLQVISARLDVLLVSHKFMAWHRRRPSSSKCRRHMLVHCCVSTPLEQQPYVAPHVGERNGLDKSGIRYGGIKKNNNNIKKKKKKTLSLMSAKLIQSITKQLTTGLKPYT
jgi:hypothetical protein